MPPSLADLWQTKTTHSSTLTANWRGPDPSAVVRDALMGKPHTLAVDDPWSRERYPLIQFVREAWHVIEPRPFVEGWHIEAITMHLEAVIRRDIKRLLINVPMRSGKSVVQCVLFPAWVWITDPAHKFLCTSYSKDLALRDSVRCRQLMLSSWYRERWGSRFRLQGDVNVKSRYANDKGGYRITSAVGGATGDGGDTLICMPGDQRILTEHGWIPIQEIVNRRLNIHVIAFDHRKGCLSAKPILRFYRRNITGSGSDFISKMLYTIRTASGGRIVVTGNHPVYTVEHGYIHAYKVKKGDTILYASNLPSKRTPVRLLPKILCDARRASTHSQGKKTFLLNGLCRTMECRGEQSCQWAESDGSVRCMPQRIQDKTHSYKSYGKVLLSHMPWNSEARSAVACRNNSYAMHGMRQRYSLPTITDSQQRENILLSGMCRQGTPRCFVWGKEWQVCPWQSTRKISSQLFGDIEATNSGSRQAVCDMPYATREELGIDWARPRCPSCGLQQEPQQRRQSCCVMQMVSWEDAWQQKKQECMDEAPSDIPCYEAVVSCIPLKRATIVYNIEVEEHNNYFAEGILVHNCDDLHSRNEDDSPSRADILAAVNFFNGDFAGCLTDPRDSAIIVSGQRIAVDDISADLLSKGDYVHLKIRQEYIPPPPGQEEPRTIIGWCDPRTQLGELMWPARWGPEQVAEAKRRGLRKYMAHHQQDPEGSGGTLFNDEWWKTFTQWPSLEIFRKIVQSWDMRFKDDKEEGSFVVGQVWGLAPNGTNVFLLDEVRGRWDFNETKEAFEALCQKWPTVRIKLIENKANGPAIYSALRAKTYGITLVDVDEGKFARGEKHTETAKSGQVWLPADTLVSWITDWRDEAKHYPSEPNDRIDAATQAWDHLLPRTFADDPRTEERERQRRRQQLVKRVYQQQKITASRTGA